MLELDHVVASAIISATLTNTSVFINFFSIEVRPSIIVGAVNSCAGLPLTCLTCSLDWTLYFSNELGGRSQCQIDWHFHWMFTTLVRQNTLSIILKQGSSWELRFGDITHQGRMRTNLESFDGSENDLGRVLLDKEDASIRKVSLLVQGWTIM